jgi:hypothetical protein
MPINRTVYLGRLVASSGRITIVSPSITRMTFERIVWKRLDSGVGSLSGKERP